MEGDLMEDKIACMHPEGKEAPRIDRDKYETIKRCILNTIQEHEIISFKQLRVEVTHQLKGNFNGSISWYLTTVKLDLEARGYIKRSKRNNLQHLELA